MSEPRICKECDEPLADDEELYCDNCTFDTEEDDIEFEEDEEDEEEDE